MAQIIGMQNAQQNTGRKLNPVVNNKSVGMGGPGGTPVEPQDLGVIRLWCNIGIGDKPVAGKIASLHGWNPTEQVKEALNRKE